MSAGRRDRPLDDQPDRVIARRRRAATGDVVNHQPSMRRHERDELPSDEDLERFSDVTTTCPHCGATLYDDAEVCYQCGQAISGRARHAPMWVMVVAIVAIAGIVTAMVLLRF